MSIPNLAIAGLGGFSRGTVRSLFIAGILPSLFRLTLMDGGFTRAQSWMMNSAGSRREVSGWQVGHRRVVNAMIISRYNRIHGISIFLPAQAMQFNGKWIEAEILGYRGYALCVWPGNYILRKSHDTVVGAADGSLYRKAQI